jgi:hypothetical protein
MKTGHWFCYGKCNDIANVPAEAENPICPGCRCRTLQWIGSEQPDVRPPPPKPVPVADTFAATGFAHMRAVVGLTQSDHETQTPV